VINADGMCLVPTLILHLYLSHTHDIYDKHKRNLTDLPLHLRYTDTYQNCRIGIAIRIGYADTPIRHRYGIGEVSGK
jgi:hypothetical protein